MSRLMSYHFHRSPQPSSSEAMDIETHSEFGLISSVLQLVVVGREWASRFATERDQLWAALGTAVIDIQHIGSTAVAGILAKPVLDIAVAIESFEGGHSLVPNIVALGYDYRGEYGIPRRHYFVRGTPLRTHHLHVLEHGSAHWAAHLRFRDRLVQSPELAAQYSDLKLAAANECRGDRNLYQRLKSSSIDEIQGSLIGA